MTGVFWLNVYLLKQGLTTIRYFSAFIGFICIILLTKIVDYEAVSRLIYRIGKWISNFKRNNN